ncbi:MAG: dTMP kinase [Peptococcia bacterium]
MTEKRKGKLIVIEAPDGSGKKTQTEMLYTRLQQDGQNVRKVEFPNYQSDSSALVKMYLNGAFGHDPNAVNPYAASTFYAVDRYATFRTEWQEFYEAGGIIVADRYTTSNMVHQAVKFATNEEKEKYLQWLWDLEFNLFALPVPDLVVFLDLPPSFADRLISARKNKITGESEKDIHETNSEFLRQSYENARWVADKYHWTTISCVQNNQIKTISEIHELVYRALIAKLF